MKKVIMLRGLPGSGKSTWAKEFVSRQTVGTWKRTNKDDLRAMIDIGRWSRGNEAFVLAIRDAIVKEALVAGSSVIVDDTNFEGKHESRLRQIAEENGAEFEIKDFEVSLDTAIERDRKRPNGVGETVIKSMYYKYIYLKPILKQDGLPAILCDLDGTIAVLNGRSPYDAANCSTDGLNEPVAWILRKYLDQGGTVVYMSGREDRHRAETHEWLKKHDLFRTGCFLYMRETGDFRKDAIVKRELFDRLVNPNFRIEFVLDDRDQVVEMWRACGLTCFQVAEGNF